MKILFIGTSFGNSYLQYLTLKKIYKNVDFIDTFKIFKFKKIATHLFIHLTPLIFEIIKDPTKYLDEKGKPADRDEVLITKRLLNLLEY